MFLKETPKSLRSYLEVVGAVGVILNAIFLTTGRDPVIIIFSLLGVGFSGLYLYLGLAFPKLLHNSPKTIV